MRFRIRTPRESGIIEVSENLNGLTWGEAREILEDNYNIDFDYMSNVLRTQDNNKENKQMIPLTLEQTVLQLNEDNVLFMSNSEKIKSGIENINPDSYPNTIAGLKLLVSDMKHRCASEQNDIFIKKLNQIDSSLDKISSYSQEEDDLKEEAESIW